jgi:hypothetical protein
MTVIVGSAGAGATTNNAGGGSGTVSSFASVTAGTSFPTLSGGGGTGGGTVSDVSPAGGTATGGDLRVVGGTTASWPGSNLGPVAGGSLLGNSGASNTAANTTYPNGTGYGVGGAWSLGAIAGDGSAGVVIIQEYK